MARSSTSAFEASEEGRALLQKRVAYVGLVGAGLGGFFLAYRGIQIIVAGRWAYFGAPDMVFHAVAVVSLLSAYVACRSGKRSVSFIHTVELASLVGAAIAYSVMGAYIALVMRPDFIVLLAMGMGLMARSAYVPSTATRTAVLAILAAIPALAMTYLSMREMDIPKWVAIEPSMEGASGHQVAVATTGFAAAWWVCVGAVTMLTSRIIYGLRKEVSSARKLGQYTLDKKLGEGGMGVVYMAHHAMLRRPTAVKLLPLAKSGERSIARFEREVQLTARLTHPNTVTIYDYGRTPDGVFYYVMELMDGATLTQVVELGGPLPAGRVIAILDQVVGALSEAHDIGLIHRDIKPSNIMLVDQGGKPDVAKVLDFGLVKELDANDDSAELTQANSMTGTPQYISPEAIRTPEDVDARSDLYALGAVAYFLVTGTNVFEGATVVAVCSDHLTKAPTPPSERIDATVPEALEQLIMDCLAKAPDDRPQSAADVHERLRQMDDWDKWTEDDARKWWAKFRRIDDSTKEDSRSSALAATIQVDLRERAP
jgi:serine/threonine-protein kinase